MKESQFFGLIAAIFVGVSLVNLPPLAGFLGILFAILCARNEKKERYTSQNTNVVPEAPQGGTGVVRPCVCKPQAPENKSDIKPPPPERPGAPNTVIKSG